MNGNRELKKLGISFHFGHLEIRSMAEALGWNAMAVVAVATVQTDLDRLKWKTLAARSSIYHHWSPFHYCGQLQEKCHSADVRRRKRYTTNISIFFSAQQKVPQNAQR